jgi:hypothetical protein
VEIVLVQIGLASALEIIDPQVAAAVSTAGERLLSSPITGIAGCCEIAQVAETVADSMQGSEPSTPRPTPDDGLSSARSEVAAAAALRPPAPPR